MKGLVIGCGSIGERHASNLAARDDTQITVHDADSSKAESLADKIGVNRAPELGEALAGDTDFALVCTPPDTHVELSRQVLRSGTHLFIEKPLSHTLEGVAELQKMVNQRNLTAMVACNMRFHPPVVRIQEWLNQRRIGRLEFIRLRYGNYLPDWRPGDYRESYSADAEKGGGIILDAIHEFDIARHWLDDVESIYCSAGKFGDLDIKTEDTAEILIEDEGRMLAEIHMDYLRPQRARTYELLGTDGMIRWEGIGKDPERSRVEYRGMNGGHEEVVLEDDMNTMYADEMSHFLDCIGKQCSPVVGIKEGAEALKIALAAKRSSTTGRQEKAD